MQACDANARFFPRNENTHCLDSFAHDWFGLDQSMFELKLGRVRRSKTIREAQVIEQGLDIKQVHWCRLFAGVWKRQRWFSRSRGERHRLSGLSTRTSWYRSRLLPSISHEVLVRYRDWKRYRLNFSDFFQSSSKSPSATITPETSYLKLPVSLFRVPYVQT